MNPLVSDGSAITGLVLQAVFAFIFFYILYAVIRAGVAAGIERAARRGHLLPSDDRTDERPQDDPAR